MGSRVGTKGQVVIEKGIRDELGIEPGWQAIQRLVNGHIEIYFVPPDHNESVGGILSKYVKRSISEEEWHDAKERAVAEGIRKDWEETVQHEPDEREAEAS